MVQFRKRSITSNESELINSKRDQIILSVSNLGKLFILSQFEIQYARSHILYWMSILNPVLSGLLMEHERSPFDFHTIFGFWQKWAYSVEFGFQRQEIRNSFFDFWRN